MTLHRCNSWSAIQPKKQRSVRVVHGGEIPEEQMIAQFFIYSQIARVAVEISELKMITQIFVYSKITRLSVEIPE